ncbi:hypothetical protein D3C84_1008140 [compost metagenome]
MKLPVLFTISACTLAVHLNDGTFTRLYFLGMAAHPFQLAFKQVLGDVCIGG